MRLTWLWIIIDKNKRILLTKRSAEKDAFPLFWCMPWWRWEKWETAEQIVIREIKEEVWLNFKPTKLFQEIVTKRLDETFSSNRFLWNYSWEIILQKEECDWYAWYTYEETKDLQIAFNHRETIDMLKEEKLID